MNVVEKILARASGEARVTPGDVVVAKVDTLILHDLSGYLTGRVLENEVKKPIRYPERILMVFDHHFSPASEERARILQENRAFAGRHGIRVFDCGSGNLHHVAIQHGYIWPGAVVVGSDSHTNIHGALGAFGAGIGNNSHAAMVMPYGKAWFRVPVAQRIWLEGEYAPGVSPRDAAQYLVGLIGEGGAVYKALEFAGPTIQAASVSDRLLFTLMAVDVGAKTGYVDPDDKTVAYTRQWTDRPFEVPRNDPDATYEREWHLDVSQLEPQVACPPTIGNVHPVGTVAGTPITHAEIGGHGGGRIDDIRVLAELLEGHQVHPDVRLQVVPNSRWVFLQALREGLVESIYRAGGNWFPAGAGSNQATNMGALAPGERMLSTQPRNFPGRNGSPEAEVFLASAATVAASAIRGAIADPRDFIAR
jgi:3-isopropylmalate/(R)-2-methylmalate dehydratase large subunit